MEVRTQTIPIKNDREITGQTREQILPTIINQKVLSATTPFTVQVSNLRTLYCDNIAGRLLTNFTGGAEQQSIAIRGDGFTTVENNANIVTNTGANKLLAVNLVYRFTLFNVSGTLKWLEDA